ncbi:Transposon IS605 OrfB [Methylacidiphilum infernorum V4]|uniref:Transposon IS605 OrfB n=1 Tax=Methylacidiphilum infernorum (isolate V4) TaxID=481448 RepID=B3DYB8_METI4|nr:helix-turn-helix domain-containing protein [Candidatus Methylacidiphilum infernorum]ACD82395.1 Transposon IS605 OrfB [Methylacidiphilum infernorum V4]
MESTMSTGRAAKLLGVLVKTMQRWEREGRLIPAVRTDSNRRLYTESQLRDFLGLRHAVSEPTRLIIADRWYPSSRLCSVCGWKNEALTLKDRSWTCPECGTHHDRDFNAALNLKRLATATALPVASPSGNSGTAAEMVSAVVGKVTPVRDDSVEESGQEENSAHLCARF